MSVITKVYGDFGDFRRFWGGEKQSQTKPILFSPQIYLGVEKAIWKNKPNFRVGKMSLSVYMKGEYEEYQALKAAKKQSQFISYWVLRDAYCERNMKKQSQFKAKQSQNASLWPEILSTKL